MIGDSLDLILKSVVGEHRLCPPRKVIKKYPSDNHANYARAPEPQKYDSKIVNAHQNAACATKAMESVGKTNHESKELVAYCVS